MDISSSFVFIESPEDFIIIDKYDDIINNYENIYIENLYYYKIIQFDLNNWINHLNYIKSNLIIEDNNWKQFELDANRSDIYINNKHILDPIIIKNKYNYLDNVVKNIIWIFSSQIAYVIPFDFINKDITKKGYYLAELSTNDIDFFNINKKMVININESEKQNYFILNTSKILRIFKMINDIDITISLVNINIDFNINNPNNSFLKIEFIPTF
jgi:hypothetical protein